MLLGWSIFFTSYITYFGSLDSLKLEHFFNGDLLGIPAIFDDILRNNGKLKDWYLASAPCLFPDFFLYYLLTLIFDFNFILVFFFYGLIQASLVIYFSILFLKKTLPDSLKSYVWLIPVFYSFTFLESYYFTHDGFFVTLFIYPAYHIGPFIMSLICLNIYFSKAQPVVKFVSLFVCSTLAAFSDLLFLVIFIIPFIVTKLLLLKKEFIKKDLIVVILIIASSILGLIIYKTIQTSELAHFAQPNKIYAFNNIKPSWSMFLDQIKTYIFLPGFRSVQLIATFLLPVLCFLYLMLKHKTIEYKFKFFLLFFSGFSVVVIATPILNGSYTGWDIVRYFLSPILFAMAVLAIFYGKLISHLIKNETAKRYALLILPILFLILNIFKFDSEKFHTYFSYYPDKVKEIDSVCVANNLQNGVAEYWNTKKISLFSKKDIHVHAVFSDGALYEFASNINWFRNKTFNFIITNKLDTALITKKHIIVDTITTPNFLIFKVKDFYFPDLEYFPKLVDSLQNKIQHKII